MLDAFCPQRSPAFGNGEDGAMQGRLEGGCLCGALRYELRGDPITVALCHCSICRRSAGAPVVAWAMFDRSAFAFVQGKPAIHSSSAGVERAFCGRCGSGITWSAERLAGLIDVTVATLDDPSALPPEMHIWESRRVSWFELGDVLPRHAELPPRPRDPALEPDSER
jgi:hypothetical protein